MMIKDNTNIRIRKQKRGNAIELFQKKLHDI